MLNFLIIALVFYLLGRYSRTSPDTQRKDLSDSIDSIVDKAKNLTKPKVKPGVLPFKTPQEFDAERSGDKALEKHWRESGIAEEIMK